MKLIRFFIVLIILLFPLSVMAGGDPIKSAESAGPSDRSSKATIKDWNNNVLREGTKKAEIIADPRFDSMVLGTEKPNESKINEKQSQENSTLLTTSNTDYTIIVDNKKRDVRRAVTVRLAHKVSKKDLIQIAKRIKNADRVKYERTFIEYLLPGMVIGMGLWARTDFNPNLKVDIWGLTLEDQKALLSKMTTKRRGEIGSWLNEFYPPGLITIYKKNGAFFLKRIFADGSQSQMEEKVIREPSSRGVRFAIIDSSSGDYYLIDKS